MTKKGHRILALLLVTVFAVQTILGVDESTTQKTETKAENSTAPPASTTTKPEPKVNVSASAICKKCLCDFDNSQLDCSNRNLTELLSTDDWNTLQNGDFTFQIINMEHNNLTKVTPIPAYPVNNLYLGFNQIETIAIAAFQNLTQLTKLDLSHNKLTSKALVPDVFKGLYSPSDYEPLGKVTELNLGYNDLHTLDADLFEHLPNLEELVMCKNIFKVIDTLTETAISGLTSLKTLDMSYMELKTLPPNFLHGPRNLETFILTGNLLTEIPKDWHLAVNLKHLVLDENLLKDIDGENVFPQMEKLEYLSISYMPDITKFGKGAFSGLEKLNTLIANDNPKLEKIDENAFSRKTINPEIFDYPPMEKLSLHSNNLTTLQTEILKRWDKVTFIDLRSNPWACDASNSWLIKILVPQINNTTPLLLSDVICATPADLKGTPLLDPRAVEATDNIASTSVAWVCVLIALLVGIPLIIGTVVVYRRGCFGLLYRRTSPVGAHYSRAESAEDLHI